MEDLVKRINRILDLAYVILAFWAIGQALTWIMSFS
jgi:hypothetical protein